LFGFYPGTPDPVAYASENALILLKTPSKLTAFNLTGTLTVGY
jgi:hypothetical protein